MTQAERDRETLPPTEPDADAEAFEAVISERGEDQARWAYHLAVLEHHLW